MAREKLAAGANGADDTLRKHNKHLTQFVPIGISLFSIVVAVGSAHFSGNVNQSLRTLDLMMQCQGRYERIHYDVRSEAVSGQRDHREYFERYWALQHDQYQYWKDGFIDEDIYFYWMYLRHLEWERNEKLRTMTYQDGWAFSVEHLGREGSDFHRFMRSVFRGRHRLVTAYDKQSKEENKTG